MNAVVALETALDPADLLGRLLEIEREFGRDRAASFKNGPRTLDLDILLFGDRKISEPDLEIPHPRLSERAFVLVPLNEIAAEVVEPLSGKTVGQLLNNLRAGSSNETDAVFPIQSDVWRAGAHGGGTAGA